MFVHTVKEAKFTEEDIKALSHRIQFGGDEVVQAKDGAGSATLSMVGGFCYSVEQCRAVLKSSCLHFYTVSFYLTKTFTCTFIGLCRCPVHGQYSISLERWKRHRWMRLCWEQSHRCTILLHTGMSMTLLFKQKFKNIKKNCFAILIVLYCSLHIFWTDCYDMNIQGSSR